MQATGPEVTRRALLGFAAAAAAGAADPAGETWDLIAAMAAALGRGSATEFLSCCDPAMPDYDLLRTNVTALIAAVEIESAVDPLRNEGDEHARALELEWSLHLVDRAGLQRVTRRGGRIKCALEKRGSRWKVVALGPVSLFAPPSA